MKNKILRSIAHLACGHYRLVLWITMILTILAWSPLLISWLKGGLHAPFDVAKLLPQDVKSAKDFTQALTNFDSVDEAVVVLHLGSKEEQKLPPDSREKYLPVAEKIADRIVELLQNEKEIQSVFCKKFRPEDKDYLLYDALPSYGLLLLGSEEVKNIEDLFSPEGIKKSVKNLKTRLSSSVTASLAMDEWIMLDALGLGTVFQRALGKYGVSNQNSKDKGYLVDKNNLMLLIVAQPDRPAQSINFSQKIMKTIKDATYLACDELLPEAIKNSITVEFGGGYEAATRYTWRVNENLFSTFMTTLIGVLLLFGFTYKRVGVILYVGAPLLIIVSWTIGIGWIMFGQLNIISAAFAAVLVGLGVDYAIHVYNRYIEERALGNNVENAFANAMQNTGWGIIIGMITTALAFLALMATRFSQLAEFGILAGIGILLAAPAMLIVLPALLAWRQKKNAEKPSVLKPSNLGLPWLANIIEKHQYSMLVIGIVLAAVCAIKLITAPQAIIFDERVANLRPPERVFELGGEIAKAFSNRNPNSLMLINYADTEANAVENAAKIGRKCEVLEHIEIKNKKNILTPLLLAYESITRYLPPPSEQEKMLEVLKKIDLQRVKDNFLKALDDEGLDPEFFEFNFELLDRHQKRVEENKVVLPTDLKNSPLWRYIKRFVTPQRKVLELSEELPENISFPVTLATPAIARNSQVKAQVGDKLTKEQVINLYQNPELNWQNQVKRITIIDKGWAIKTNIYPPVDESTQAGDSLIDEVWLATIDNELDISKNNGSIILTGIPILAHDLAGIVKSDFQKVSLVVFTICVIILLLFFYRKPVKVLYSLLPLCLGLLYLFGFMSFFEIPFNFVNTLVVPIIIGLGVDNGIHLVERFYEQPNTIRPMITETGRALIITALTSVAGFGSLAISGYEGTASMGRLTIYALGWVLFASLIVTPATIGICNGLAKKKQPNK